MTAAVRLREAATVLREKAEAATPGPWVIKDCSDATFDSEDHRGWWWVWQESRLPYYGGVAEVNQRPDNCSCAGEFCHGGQVAEANITDTQRGDQERADAAFIALMSPPVALAMADFLDSIAGDIEQYLWVAQAYTEHPDNKYPAKVTQALAVADAILGASS